MQTASTEGSQSPAPLQTLTRKAHGGTPYHRDPRIEQQIVVALGLAPDALIERIRVRNQEDADYCQEETLVYLIREHYQSRDDATVNALATELVERCQPLFRSKFRLLEQEEAEQAQSHVIEKVFTAILDFTGDRGDALQVCFWRVLECMAINTFRQVTARLNRYKLVPLSSIVGQVDEPDEDVGVASAPTVHLPNPQLSLEDQALLATALAAIEEPYRTAYILHHREGWQIESKDEAEPTVSKYFQRTPRMIRIWLKKADEALERWRGNSHE